MSSVKDARNNVSAEQVKISDNVIIFVASLLAKLALVTQNSVVT